MATIREIFRPGFQPIRNRVKELFSPNNYASKEEVRLLSERGWVSLKQELLPPNSPKRKEKATRLMQNAIQLAAEANPSLIPLLINLPLGAVRCYENGEEDYRVEPEVIAPLIQDFLTSLNEVSRKTARPKEKQAESVNPQEIIEKVGKILILDKDAWPNIRTVLFDGKLNDGESLPEFLARFGFSEQPQATKTDPGDPFADYDSLEDILLALYLQEIDLPQLTRQEEVFLSTIVWLGKNVNPTTAPDYWPILETKITPARNWLILANAYLAISISREYEIGVPKEKKYPTFFLDLIQAASEGLVRAADHFDFRRNLKFSTYSKWWIKNIVTQELAKRNLIEIPGWRRQQLRQAKESQLTRAQKEGRMPGLALTLAEESGIKFTEATNVVAFNQALVSTQERTNPENPKSQLLEDELEDPRATEEFDQKLEQRLLSEEVRSVLETLPPREAMLLRRRFNLSDDDGKNRTLKDVGRDFGIHKETARKIEEQALARLRHPSRTRKLKDWY